ncbi:adenosine-specific kinase [Candidatus Micrarchaeota archaeon]|nr:adenosine-specific kinase [Candidatus Micrarchaeota archaeon]MBI5176851.1 adenosine-specific kinase [Candidatus Micrarchaeota archaeon]
MALEQQPPELVVQTISIPEGANAILGGTHFIKTAEDIYETLAESSPQIKFGVAFCEASGKCLVRSEGNDAELVRAAEGEALKLGCGHTFVIFLRDAFPVSVLNRIKLVSEVTCIFAATANPLQVIIARTGQGRGIVGVIDGSPTRGIETDADKTERRGLLRKFGYKK